MLSKAASAAHLAFTALGLSLLAAAARAAPMGILTFIEVRAASSAEASAVLTREARASHRELLQEIARPDRFVLIERSEREPPAREAAAGVTLPDALGTLLVAPPDRRTHHDFADPADARAVSPATAAHAVYLIAHVDIGGPNQPTAQEALRALEPEARASAGNLRFDVWQQSDRANHYNIVAAWRSAADLDAFEASDAAREFRRIVAPLIGSLYDERRYRRVD